MSNRIGNRASRRAAEKQAKQQIKHAIKNRSCGPCSACCFTQSVSEIDKPVFSRCPHMIEKDGCEIYSHRPSGCKKWNCLWRSGFLAMKDRPDLCGIVFDVTQGVSRMYPNGQAVIAREFFSGAFEKSEALLEEMASDKIVLLMNSKDDGYVAMGPKDQLAFLEDMVRKVQNKE
jgi:hypothetical protein